jgi:RNA polymerase sigma factor (sigma-70 family)
LKEKKQKNLYLKFSVKEMEKNDAELLLACRKGDQGAWNELVERFQRLICTIPRRAGLDEEQVSDVFQEVFLTLFEKLAEIEQPEKLRAWLVTTAKFKTWKLIRKKKPTESLDDEESRLPNQLDDGNPFPDEIVIEIEEQHLIRTAIKKLENRCQKIITMIYLQRVPASYEEVSKKIGVGKTSISPLRARCLKKLAKFLKL